jgi:hypothetical protein
MAAFSLPCPSCGAVLTFGAPPAAGKSFRCPKCQTTFKAPTSDPEPEEFPAQPVRQSAVRAAGAKPATVRKSTAESENAFSFVEEERIAEAMEPSPRRGGGCLILSVIGFLFLLIGVGGGGFAALYFTGALSPKAAKPPDDAKAPPTPPPFLGRWELKDVKPALYIEFRDNGTLVNGGGGTEVKGTWKLDDSTSDTIDVTLDVLGKEPMKRRLKFEATKDQLTLTDEQNHAEVYQRAAQ